MKVKIVSMKPLEVGSTFTNDDGFYSRAYAFRKKAFTVTDCYPKGNGISYWVEAECEDDLTDLNGQEYAKA